MVSSLPEPYLFKYYWYSDFVVLPPYSIFFSPSQRTPYTTALGLGKDCSLKHGWFYSVALDGPRSGRKRKYFGWKYTRSTNKSHRACCNKVTTFYQ